MKLVKRKSLFDKLVQIEQKLDMMGEYMDGLKRRMEKIELDGTCQNANEEQILERIKHIEERIERVEADGERQNANDEQVLERVKHIEERIERVEADGERQNANDEQVLERVKHIEERIERVEADGERQNANDEQVLEHVRHIEDRVKVDGERQNANDEQVLERVEHIEERIVKHTKQSKEDILVTNKVLISMANAALRSPKKRVHFIRCYDIYNTGDMNCGPELFFKDFIDRYVCFFHSIKYINYQIIEKEDWIIIGGGGMLDCNPDYQNAINHLLSTNTHVIGWGLGHNRVDKNVLYHYDVLPNIAYDKFNLLGDRDYQYSEFGKFCPCVSCMMPQLERKTKVERNVGIYYHHEIEIEQNLLTNYDHLSNSAPIEEVMDFFASSNIIMTNTYHGAYWATLMGKKVILYKPFGERFRFFKYQPRVYSGNIEEDIRRANCYPQALEEFRNINVEFKNMIIDRIADCQDSCQ